MKTNVLFLFTCLCIIGYTLTGCSDEQIDPTPSTTQGEKFTLYASIEAPDSRVTMNGLELKWENGDKLYMVNTAGGTPIELVTNLSEPSTEAIFSSENEVPEGNYYVMYNNQAINLETPATYTYASDKDFVNQIKMYSDPLNINAGDKSAIITLKHSQAKIRFNIKKGNEDYTLNAGCNIGIAIENDGFFTKASLNNNSINCTDKTIMIGANIQSSTNCISLATFPCNLENKNLHFFVSEGNKVFELIKKGKDLKAGYNYDIDFDLDQALSIEQNIESSGQYVIPRWDRYYISNTDQFKALAFISNILNNDRVKYANITTDLDFQDNIFIPTGAITMEGNNQILRNITITYTDVNNIGIIRSDLSNAHIGSVSDLILENVTIQGNNNVGAFMGYCSTSSFNNCTLQGNNTIIGNENVGGICGYKNEDGTFENCHVESTISGKTNVGGICGLYDIIKPIYQCSTKGSIQGTTNIGGIVGSGPCDLSECYSQATITGETCVGGIIGSGGNNITLCYTTGNVSANTEKAGGIAGESGSPSIIACYSLGDILSPTYASGIIGYKNSTWDSTVSYCYSSGNISENGSGIATGIALHIDNCATTFKNLDLSSSDNYEDFTNCNGTDKTIRSVLSKGTDFTIYYSAKDWSTEEVHIAGCPIFLWQSSGIQIGVGDSGTNIPSFIDGGKFE